MFECKIMGDSWSEPVTSIGDDRPTMGSGRGEGVSFSGLKTMYCYLRAKTGGLLRARLMRRLGSYGQVFDNDDFSHVGHLGFL